jgi:hypothetical protein
MGKWLAVVALFALAVAPARAEVVNFDDLPVFTIVPSNYAGLTWGPDWTVVDDAEYAGYGNTYGAPSPRTAAYNGDGVLSVSLTSGADFDFIGAYFTGWASDDDYAPYTSTSITVEGYNGGSFVGSVSMPLSADRYDWLAANLRGVDELRFRNDGVDARWWLVDDLTYEPVPEPGTLALLGGGLAGLFLRRRRPRPRPRPRPEMSRFKI